MLKGAIHPFTYRGEGILAAFVKIINWHIPAKCVIL